MPRSSQRTVRGGAAVLAAVAVLSGGYLGIRQVAAGGAAPNFSGTFDCYDGATCPSSELPAAATCTSHLTSGSGLQTALNGASGGNVICLGGTTSYGNISLTSKTYSSDVIVQPESGTAAVVGTLTLSAVKHLHFTGNGGGGSSLTLGGTSLSQISGASTNITIDYTSWHACTEVDANASATAILFNHDRWDNLSSSQNGQGTAGCPNEARLYPNGSGGTAGWFTVSNSHFGGQDQTTLDCSDGIQVGADRVTIGPGNEFTGIYQVRPSDSHDCTTHADPVQTNGGNNAILTGNYFHDNDGSGGCMCHDFNPDGWTITNNVFNSFGCDLDPANCNYPSIMLDNAETNFTLAHNYFRDNVNADGTVSGMVFTNNAFRQSQQAQCTSGCTFTYNLWSGHAGTGNINSGPDPVFVSSPATGYYHFELDPSSQGYHVASDGKSMGICSGCG